MNRAALFVFLFLINVFVYSENESYLTWNQQQLLAIGKGMRVDGRVGGFWDLRVRHTEKSYNFKLRATWLTPDVIRASARYNQIKNRLTTDQTSTIVAEAESIRDTVILVEIDPREGSGVIPLEWQAWLQPKSKEESAELGVPGINTPNLRQIKGLSGIFERDYDYDVFWMVFPLIKDGTPLFSENQTTAELIVRIYNKEGRVEWLIPKSIRNQINKQINEKKF